MSKMMLEGWALTPSVCRRAGCHTPLLRNRQGELYCTSCEARVVIENTEDEAEGTGRRAATARALLERRQQQQLQEPEEAPERQAASAPAERASLQRAVVEQPAQPAAASLQRSEPQQPAAVPARPVRSSSDEASRRLGEKLLAGWRMLAATCADCGVPLMQPRDAPGRQFCVSCETWRAADGGEQQQQQQQQHPGGSPAVSGSGVNGEAPAQRGPSTEQAQRLAPAVPVRPAAAVNSSAMEVDERGEEEDEDAAAALLQRQLLERHRQRAEATAAAASRITSPPPSTAPPAQGAAPVP
jgi:uncharacterized Zn finger protein (UPF0148 family)